MSGAYGKPVTRARTGAALMLMLLAGSAVVANQAQTEQSAGSGSTSAPTSSGTQGQPATGGAPGQTPAAAPVPANRSFSNPKASGPKAGLMPPMPGGAPQAPKAASTAPKVLPQGVPTEQAITALEGQTTQATPASSSTTPEPTAPSDDQAQYPEQVPVYTEEAPAQAPTDEAAQAADGAAPEQGADASGELPKSGVAVSEFLTVDIFVQDEDLANVLQMLSLQSRKNIVASRDVNARVTANLYGVTFYEALDSILHVNGYGYIERGNFIYVYTLAELATIQAEVRQVVSKVIQLSYLNANDAAEFVAPLLSEKGQIKTNGDAGDFQLPESDPTGNEEFALAATLVVYDYAEHVEEIEKLLMQLDTRPSQVLVESTILQTELNEANAFGVDFSLLDGVNFTDFFDIGGPLGVANELLAGDDFVPSDNKGLGVVGSPGNTGGPGTIKLSLLQDDFGVFIRALDEVSNVTILSNPKVMALNRQPARVNVGRKLGYLNSTSNENTVTQSVEFLDTGTSLSFRPFISKDGTIRLELKPRVSEGVIRELTNNDGDPVTIPNEITQEVTTNVIVPDGSTVVLGGLFRENTRLGRTQVPVLGDIPIIGAAFRGHDDETERSEVIFMVKPTVMNDQVLVDQGERGTDYTEHVRTGSRQGLLPFSRDRQTSQLNVKAERLAAEGKTDKALWVLRRSLELNPVQPEVIRLQEELMGKSNRIPTRSMLDRVINGDQRNVGSQSRLSEDELLSDRASFELAEPTMSLDEASEVAGYTDDEGDAFEVPSSEAQLEFLPEGYEPQGDEGIEQVEPFEIEPGMETDGGFGVEPLSGTQQPLRGTTTGQFRDASYAGAWWATPGTQWSSLWKGLEVPPSAARETVELPESTDSEASANPADPD